MIGAAMSRQADKHMDAVAMPIAELRFLLVEDHDFQRWAIRKILEGLGARFIFEAADGRGSGDLREYG